MPSLETPPNPAPTDPTTSGTPQPDNLHSVAPTSIVPDQPAPVRISAGRHGELDHTELVHLIDTLDDDRERARFRESIYISLFVYIAIAWLVLYGPRVLWHTPQIVPVKTDESHHQVTELETPRDLQKLLNRTPSPRPTPRPTPRPEAAPAPKAAPPAPKPTPVPKAAPTPKPLPNAPQPVAPTPAPQPPPPRPASPTPQPTPRPTATRQPALPDAPKPSSASSRPNFSQPNESLADIAKGAIPGRGGNGVSTDSPGSGGKPSLSSGAEILSDTQGVDFGPYIKRILAMIRAGWLPLIPEETRPPLNKEGQTLIRFTIDRDGTLRAMHLDASTHDHAIDEAAWGGIKSVGQYPQLPADFKGPNLELRIQFIISHNYKDRGSAQ